MCDKITVEIFERQLVEYIANTSIGIYALRNQYSKKEKAVDKCRSYVKKHIRPDVFFRELEGDDFERFLDHHTKAIESETKLKFGSARKVLNIFLRNLAYNGFLQQKYLNEHADLITNRSVLNKLEVPVDSYVAKGLLTEFQLSSKQWVGIKNLVKPEQHRVYQEYASKVAERRGVARPHLDLEFYNQAKENNT